MKLSHSIVSALAAFTQFVPRVAAHSKAPDGISYLSSVENAVIHTESGLIDYLSTFSITFHLHHFQQRIRLDLSPNHDIIGENAYVQFLDQNGHVKRSEEIQRHDHKVFKGLVFVEEQAEEWQEVGRARIYVKADGVNPMMEGSFDILGDHHHVQLRSAYSRMRRRSDIAVADREEESMIIYRDSDMVAREEKRDDDAETPSCGADNLAFNFDSTLQSRSPAVGSFHSPKKRQSGNIGTGNLRLSIGSTRGCPIESRVALVGIATDCTYTASFNGDNEAIRQNLITMVNSASSAYEDSFNIALGLRNVTILDSTCPTSSDTATPWNLPCAQGDIESRLDAFSQWRGALGDDNAYWTMMSTCASGRSVGLAWLGQLCVSTLTGYGEQSVSGANVVVRTAGEWQVFAHESAHTFGAVHDCDSSACATSAGSSRCCPVSTSSCDAAGAYLMSPVSGRGLTEFSPCTIGNICSGLGSNRVRDSCLVSNRNLTTLTGSQCGNGIVEAGEDCDCGGEASCAGNNCCNPTTCRFINNSVCDDSNDACCTSCQFTPANTVCRASTGICDREETCSGSSSTCPTDTFLPNGQECGGGNGLACASGQCTSRDLQCQTTADVRTTGNYTEACNTNSCTLTCVSSSSSSFCAAMDQYFLDGTPCSNGRTCSNGGCTSRSTDNTNNNNGGSNSNNNGIFGGGESAGSWIDRNRSLFIGLVAGLGGAFVLAVLCCLFSCCRKSRRQKKARAMPVSQRPPMGQWNPNAGGYGGPPPPMYPNQAHVGGYDPRLARTPTFRYA